MAPTLAPVALGDLFRRLNLLFADQAESRGLALRLRPGGRSVRSDAQMLERVLVNLLQNAIKYTVDGGVAVVARATATHVNIEVWDTGIGIPADELPRVFDEFHQVAAGGRRPAEGLGMGLAIARQLAELLGCGLSIRSHPGSGTMVRVAVPRADDGATG